MMVISCSLFSYFDSVFFCFPFAIFDLVYDVEVVFHLSQTYHHQCQNNVKNTNSCLFYSY